MASDSASAYRDACARYLAEVFERPSMYFHSLPELEWQLIGHAQAYEELGFIQRPECFHRCFSEWLWTSKSLSCPSGWAYTIERRAAEEDDPAAVAFQLIREFLAEWIAPPD